MSGSFLPAFVAGYVVASAAWALLGSVAGAYRTYRLPRAQVDLSPVGVLSVAVPGAAAEVRLTREQAEGLGSQLRRFLDWAG